MLFGYFQLLNPNRLTNHVVRDLQSMWRHNIEDVEPDSILSQITFWAHNRQKVIVDVERFSLEFGEKLQKFFISKLKKYFTFLRFPVLFRL